MRQVALPCLRCYTLPSCWLALPVPSTTSYPSPQGFSSFGWEDPWVFWLLPAQLCHPLSHPRSKERVLQFSFAFPGTGLHTPVCGARLCLSSRVPAHPLPSLFSPYIAAAFGVALVRESQWRSPWVMQWTGELELCH
ncbi:hypothetical protein HJG60_011251 [Phyllostomus discolor]|uniref:Uncharacterized protein n=1 Tax=Phyllostomus discolor TaxID=89673 RepID=A0A834E566_9CHIR|nr:hypothetical protein HJG60_011251 [Phyllostomus discolor]